ncbi:uncharacterized protein LOC112598356 [Melanaphis sacchari]|uniref:uncharacterized protein LOC112598356 n=1 Tax=Melanaphis sacchari TaxID=742174 RepID=UPI000DC14535|nr:uncharacterized protein LOC112598356 [Melanaphis sacchari]
MNVDAEAIFYITKGIMTLEEIKKLNDDRENLDLSLLIGLTTNDQLFDHILIEMDIFCKCRKRIEEKDKYTKRSIFLLLMLFDRINDMFVYMVSLFTIKAEYIQKYAQFCSDHLPQIVAVSHTTLE